MATRKFLSGMSILILATLACTGGGLVPNVQPTVETVQATKSELGGGVSVETPTRLVSSPVPVSRTPDTAINPSVDEQSPCEASKWRVVALWKFEQPSGLGLKVVNVGLGIHNGSSKGGSFFINGVTAYPPSATTEGGFTYPGQVVSGGRPDGGALKVTPREVPPGFTIVGAQWHDKPQIAEDLMMLFEVADTQNKLSITFPSITVICYAPTGEGLSEVTTSPLIVDVEKDIDGKPLEDIAAQFENIKSISEGVDLGNLGRLEFIDAKREPGGPNEDEMLTMRFKFMNASAGYKTSGSIHSYLLGNNGVAYSDENYFNMFSSAGKFEAGPGQTSEVELKYPSIGFSDKYALVIETVVDTASYTLIPIYQVFGLP